MSHPLEDLPLFPLNTVLFPHASIKLNIFEDRYREMVRMCLREDRPFGIVLIREGSEVGPAEPYMVGTSCRIREVRTFDDGGMEISVTGESRFRIRDLDDQNAYLVGKVEPVIEHEMENRDQSDEVVARARDIFEALIRLAIEREDFVVKVVLPTDPVVLSFAIANHLQMENLQKQRLLETTDTLERIEDLLPMLERQILEGGFSSKTGPAYYRLTSEDLQDWLFNN